MSSGGGSQAVRQNTAPGAYVQTAQQNLMDTTKNFTSPFQQNAFTNQNPPLGVGPTLWNSPYARYSATQVPPWMNAQPYQPASPGGGTFAGWGGSGPPVSPVLSPAPAWGGSGPPVSPVLSPAPAGQGTFAGWGGSPVSWIQRRTPS